MCVNVFARRGVDATEDAALILGDDSDFRGVDDALVGTGDTLTS